MEGSWTSLLAPVYIVGRGALVTNSSILLNHLQRDYTEPIRDPLWRNIQLSPALMRIIDTPPFQKLARIRQLGAAHQVYPGATHTRFSHSLGVMHLARRILIAILAHPSEIAVSLEGVKGFLCAALLHDLGHFPFAHSLKELPLREHESLTAEIVTSRPLAGLIRSEVGVDPSLVAAIVDPTIPATQWPAELLFFRRILSGVLDPDKLDYLNRDAYFCGVPYGIQDTDFVISRMRPHPTGGIAVDSQGVTGVEHVLFAKYLMYRTVYWHKTVRIATAMIKKAVFLLLRSGALHPAELYGLDDGEFFARLSEVSHPATALATRVAERDFLKVLLEEPFDTANELHRQLTDLDARTRFEEAIARRLAKELREPVAAEEIIIDIPEPISFEADIQVVESPPSDPAGRGESIFTGPTVAGFAATLRRVRIIGPRGLAGRIGDPGSLLDAE